MTARLLTPYQIIQSGGAYILITSTPGATLTCGSDTYTLGSAETSHTFGVAAGTYSCSAALTGYTTASQNVTVTDGVTEITLKPRLLPAEYQQVDYIQSDGYAYIFNSAFGINSTDTVEVGVYIDYVYGINRTQTGNAQYIFGTDLKFQICYWYGNVSVGNSDVSYNWTIGQRYEFEFISNTLYIDNVSTGLSRSANAASNYMFWNGVSSYRKCGSVRYFKKHDSGNNTLMEMYACYRKSDYVPGLYDIVSNTFYTNSNNVGNFSCGEDIN